MQHNQRQIEYFNFTGTVAQSRRFTVGILLVMLIAFGLTTVQPVNGQRKSSQGYGKEMEVPTGLDAFKTVAGASRFSFSEEFTIPADFFDKGSSRFAGTVSFKGVPIGSYRDQKTGAADTIMERTKTASFSSRYGRSTVPIELAALSLESIRPITVRVGKEWQQWNVKLALSPSRKSEGTMTIMRRSEKGGTFNSEFVVYPVFTFTRTSDGAEKSLDVGAMKLDDKSIAKITLKATGAPWSQTVNRSGNASFRAGATLAGGATRILHNAPRDSHFVIRVPIFLNQ